MPHPSNAQASLDHDQRFWMVYVPQEHRNGTFGYSDTPKHRHATYEAAKAEAERLALKQGRPAYVLCATEKVSPVQLTTTVSL